MSFIQISEMQKFQIKTFFDGWTIFLLSLLFLNLIGAWLCLKGHIFIPILICAISFVIIIPIIFVVIHIMIHDFKGGNAV